MYTKKRKTNSNLKRCTSFPGCEDTFVSSNNFGNQEFVCNENMLREAWRKLGVGEDGNLNQTELILVCDAIGLRELADSVIRRLPKCISDIDYRISFHELLEVLQQDETWTDILNVTPKSVEETLNISCVADDSVFLNSKSVQYITLGPKGNGYINTDTVIEMWETVGITSPKHLLNDLGFTSSNDIDIVELASVLEKEIKGINETRSDFSNPHVALLQAVLALYQSEIRYLKSVLEQMQAEREKLKGDITEANNRATLLAQEVDDNHAKMEKTTRKQVRLLEQRHADILKEITEQCSLEKEQLSVLNRNLEERIANLELEEGKLRNDLNLAQKYLCSVEKENQNLSTQVVELEQVRELLNEQVKLLENEKQKCHESEQMQIENLLAKLSNLQLENTKLRDRNDEMQSEIEGLTSDVTAMRMRIASTSGFNFENSMEENIAVMCEGVAGGHGSKRRSDDSPSKDLNVLGLGDGSPRLGKVRKFHKNKDVLEVPFTSSESGFETELDCLDSSLSNSCNETDDTVNRLHAKIEVLEQILTEHSIPLPSDYASQSETDSALDKIRAFPEHSTRLEELLIELKNDIGRLLPNQDDASALAGKIERLIGEKTSAIDGADIESSRKDACTETNDYENDDEYENTATLREKLNLLKHENESLKTECDDLKQCLQLMEVEYEKCEKYWSNTLDDERKVFEQEQGQYNEHLMKLTDKITEYEKDFIEKSNRLPPIEEKRKLEEQFTDLENEFEEYKEQAEFQLDEKDREIMDLKEKLDELRVTPKYTTNESATQTDFHDCRFYNLTNHVIESTNLFSEDTMPFTLSVQNTSPDVSLIAIDPSSVWGKTSIDNESQTDTAISLPVTMTLPEPQQDVKQSLSMFDLPSTSTDVVSNGSQKNCTPMRPKRTRKHDRNTISQRLYKKNSDQNSEVSLSSSNKWKGSEDLRNSKQEETVTVPVSTVHNMNGKIHHLEQRCRHLQMVIKQQHYHAEQVLQHCWQQQREEKIQLQYILKATQEKLDRQIRMCNEQLERLTRTDLLVKDLYVENAFLVANVQRLEQKCHLLSQCNSNNSV
ncbi:ninein [Holotrichia oblita]|uniref:Ninein n=1 Tax=Holotrichia oblita TaxID=644536 RepID=A0ACB9T5T3_HOLOL|nr:ninein [Holotrichia oblita]